jgi:hypothetical protein
MVQFDGELDPERKMLAQVKRIIPPYIWRIKRESRPIYPPKEYKHIGLINHKFDAFSKINLRDKDFKYPFFDLLLRLWPGDWQEQLRNLNQQIATENEDRAKAKKVRQVSEHEFFKFIGILLAATRLGKGGKALWEKKMPRERTCSDPIDFGPVKTGGQGIFPEYRFHQIKHVFLHAFTDEEAKQRGDKWHPIGLLVDRFNLNCAQCVVASSLKVLDELMSAWRPRTTQQCGGLPHLSFIGRKPKRLGTEFKVSPELLGDNYMMLLLIYVLLYNYSLYAVPFRE